MTIDQLMYGTIAITQDPLYLNVSNLSWPMSMLPLATSQSEHHHIGLPDGLIMQTTIAWVQFYPIIHICTLLWYRTHTT